MARIVNRLIAVTVASTLGAGAIMAVLELGALLLGRDPLMLDYDRWLERGQSLTWADPGVRLGSGAALAAGAALLIVQLAQWRPATLALRGGEGTLSLSLDRRSLEHALNRAARAVEGVGAARAKVSRRRVSMVITPRRIGSDELAARVRQAAAATLAGIPLVRELHINVKLATKRSRR